MREWDLLHVYGWWLWKWCSWFRRWSLKVLLSWILSAAVASAPPVPSSVVSMMVATWPVSLLLVGSVPVSTSLVINLMISLVASLVVPLVVAISSPRVVVLLPPVRAPRPVIVIHHAVELWWCCCHSKECLFSLQVLFGFHKVFKNFTTWLTVDFSLLLWYVYIINENCIRCHKKNISVKDEILPEINLSRNVIVQVHKKGKLVPFNFAHTKWGKIIFGKYTNIH